MFSGLWRRVVRRPYACGLVLTAAVLFAVVGHALPSSSSWNEVASYPGAISAGSGICYVTGSDTIYALAGNDTKIFWGYASSNNWYRLASLPTARKVGKGLCYVNGGDTVYALRGDGLGSEIYGYSISRNAWDTLAAAPANFGLGSALCYPGTGDTIYATRGGNSTDFYGYSISKNTWTALAVTPGALGEGADVCHVTGSDTIYALRGSTTTDFYGYSMSRNQWATTLAATPLAIGAGGSLAYPGRGDTIYALRGGNTTTFYGFSISANAWGTHTAIDYAVDSGGCMTAKDTNLFALRGHSSNEYEYYEADVSGLAPAAPYNTTQWSKTGAAIASGDSIVIYETVTLRAMSNHLLLPSDTFWLEFELRETGTAFTSPGTPTIDNTIFFRSAVSASSAAETLSMTASGLKLGTYKWQVRAVGAAGDTTAWTYAGKSFGVAVKPCTTLFPVNRVATPTETNPTFSLPWGWQDTFLQVYLGNGDTSAGVLANSTNETGIGANYAETVPLISGVDTLSIHYWTNQRFIQTFVGLRVDTGNLDTAGLPAGIIGDTGRRAFGISAFQLQIADATGYPGDTTTSKSVGDSVAYTLRFYLSLPTALLYNALGFDTAVGSGSFGLYCADTYGGRWTQVGQCRVTAAPVPWYICVTVTGVTRTGVLGLGRYVAGSSGGMGGGGDCVITRLGVPGRLLVWMRLLRDWMMSTCVGRLVAAGYYSISSAV